MSEITDYRLFTFRHHMYPTRLKQLHGQLGVTYYLSKDDDANMLKTISSFAPEGSSLSFDYADDKFLYSEVKRVLNGGGCR